MFDYKSLDWKKIAVSAVAGVIVWFVLGHVIPTLLSAGVVSVAGGLVAAYLVYTQVANWELKNLLDEAKKLVGMGDKK